MIKAEQDRLYPKLPDILSISMVTISVFILCYSFLVPVVPILAFLGMWLPLALYKRQFILKPSKDMALMLAFPFTCFISFLWSDYTGRSLYTGTQFLTMAMCLVIMTRIVRYKSYIQGLSCGISLVLMASLTYAVATLGSSIGALPVSGLFGSKNQLGFVAVVGVLIALLVLFGDFPRLRKVFLGIGTLLLCLISLSLSHSITSIISILFTLGLLMGAWLITRFPIKARGIIVFLILLLISTVSFTIYALDIKPIEAILTAAGKDPTLTGRTYLWEEGINHALNNPVLGHGYDAFWVPFNPPAEKYWDEFGIPGQTGFNFHNLYVETFVTFGGLGLIIICSVILYLVLNGFYLILRDGLNIQTSLFFGLSSLMLARSFSEVEFFGPFGLSTLIIYTMVIRISSYKNQRDILSSN